MARVRATVRRRRWLSGSGTFREARSTTDAEAEGQQVARVIGRCAGTVSSSGRVDPRQHAPVGEFRQEPVDRIVEAQLASFDQNQRRNRGDRLGHRRDAEQRVALHRLGASGGVMPMAFT